MLNLLPALLLLLARLGLADSRNSSRFPCPPRPGLRGGPAAAEVTKLAPHNIGMVTQQIPILRIIMMCRLRHWETQ